MTTKRWRLLVIVLCMTVTTIAISLLCFWQYRLKPWFVYEKARYGNMAFIAAGVSEFVIETRRMPKDLKEIIESGHLPEDSPIYECPLLHDSLKDRAIPYPACEYDVRFEPNEVVIALPRAAVDQKRLNATPRYLIECRVDSRGQMVLPVDRDCT